MKKCIAAAMAVVLSLIASLAQAAPRKTVQVTVPPGTNLQVKVVGGTSGGTSGQTAAQELGWDGKPGRGMALEDTDNRDLEAQAIEKGVRTMINGYATTKKQGETLMRKHRKLNKRVSADEQRLTRIEKDHRRGLRSLNQEALIVLGVLLLIFIGFVVAFLALRGRHYELCRVVNGFDVPRLQREVNTLGGRLGTVVGQVRTLEGRVNPLPAQIHALEMAQHTQDHELGTLRRDHDRLERDMAAHDLHGLRADVRMLRADHDRVQRQADGYEPRLSGIEVWRGGIDRVLEGVADEIVHHRDQIDDIITRI